MPLNENTRLSRDMREKIRYLLRSFYNRLLVEPIPSRVLVTIKADEGAKHAARASGNPADHSS